MFHPEVTSRHTEMRRGEAAVKAGRQQVLLVVEERKLESPAKDLPKIADQLKGEILAERSLKPTEAQEKNVLPSADDVKQEKNHQNIMTGTDRQTDRHDIYLPSAFTVQGSQGSRVTL